MIAFIEGTVAEVTAESVIVEAGGIGYDIYCANPFHFQKYKGERIKIHTYHYVREDLIALYGFLIGEERSLFAKLLGVSGIGPKGALAILAGCTPDEVVTAIESEDEQYLTKFPGIGKKTARQMILDLKGKLDTITAGHQMVHEQSVGSGTSRMEAIEALKSLGYADREIQKVMKKLTGDTLTADQYVKKALQHMLHS